MAHDSFRDSANLAGYDAPYGEFTLPPRTTPPGHKSDFKELSMCDKPDAAEEARQALWDALESALKKADPSDYEAIDAHIYAVHFTDDVTGEITGEGFAIQVYAEDGRVIVLSAPTRSEIYEKLREHYHLR